MEIFLVRHAVAVAHGSARTDAARALTKAGREDFAVCVNGLAALDIAFTALVHSPLRRAVETAEILVPLLDGKTRVEAALADRADRFDLSTITGERVALVGHEPYLGQLASIFVAGSSEHAARFAFEKGGVLWLKGTRAAPGTLEIVAMLPPKVLRPLSNGRS
jgi:phosphohistidine phosphatase